MLLALVLPSRAAAMTFSIGDRLQNGHVLNSPAILAEGDIVDGDAERLFNFLITNKTRIANERLSIVPSSNGGMISEALKMARILDGGMYSVWLPPSLHSDGDIRRTKCVSACFSLVVGAIGRVVMDGTVGLHRPFLTKAAYARLSVKEAQTLHEQSLSELRQWLQFKGVPNRLIDQMMSTPSTDVYWMDRDDLNALGELQAWAEELLIARCNFEPKLFENWADAARKRDQKLADMLQRQLDRQATCANKVIVARREEFLSAKPAFLGSKSK